MNNQPLCDIILPCYNPAKGWRKRLIQAVKDLQHYIPPSKLQIYLVDDGSTQHISKQDVAVLKDSLKYFKYISYNQNRGKGFAVRQGVQRSKGEICIYTDIDFPYKTESIFRLYQALKKEKADVVVGVRDQTYYQHIPRHRVYISKVFKKMIKYFLNLQISDTQGGLKGFNKKGREIFLQTTIDRYLFDLEFLYLVSRADRTTLGTTTVQLNPDVHLSNMQWSVLLTESWNFLKILLGNKR